MKREIISMPRVGSGYPYNFGIISWVFKADDFKTEVKINSRHRVCLLLVGSPLLACREQAQHPLFACRVLPLHIHIHYVLMHQIGEQIFDLVNVLFTCYGKPRDTVPEATNA